MPTRPVESTHEAEPNYPIHEDGEPGIESPSGDRMQGANGSPAQPEAATTQSRPTAPTPSRDEAGAMHAEPNPAAAGPRESTPGDKGVLPTTNEDDATEGDQDIDTAGTAHDDTSPTKSM